MVTTAGQYDTLDRLAKQSLTSVAKNIIVKRKEDYVVFEEYRIIKEAEDRFTVTDSYGQQTTFLSSRNALSYCIFLKNRKYDQAQLLIRLDTLLQRKLFDVEVAKNILNSSQDADRKFTALARVEIDIETSKDIRKQITECVNNAKYFQQRELDNEVN
tara:strand:+ start:266 stop:739 length:474 start_codon:yes stop_codon:yes gene_type:complete